MLFESDTVSTGCYVVCVRVRVRALGLWGISGGCPVSAAAAKMCTATVVYIVDIPAGIILLSKGSDSQCVTHVRWQDS